MKCNWRDIFQRTTVRSYAEHMPNYSDLTSGYSRLIVIPHSAKRVLDCRQNHHGCRQNKPRLLWNALLTTPYASEHYKHMFLVARDLYEMLVLSRGKHTSRRSTVGIWSTSISYADHEYIVGRRSALGQVSRQAAIEVPDCMKRTCLFLITTFNKCTSVNLCVLKCVYE